MAIKAIDKREDVPLETRLVEFMTTPLELRGKTPDLRAFAKQQGVPASTLVHMLKTDKSIQAALKGVAGGALLRVPNILASLGDAAEGGSIRAAEVYLEFVRKTLTDQQFMSMQDGSRDVETLVDQAVSGAQRRLEHAREHVKVTVGIDLTHRDRGAQRKQKDQFHDRVQAAVLLEGPKESVPTPDRQPVMLDLQAKHASPPAGGDVDTQEE